MLAGALNGGCRGGGEMVTVPTAIVERSRGTHAFCYALRHIDVPLPR
jgi:hypothetical protein